MTRDNTVSRRTAMKLTGAAAATALVAGCSSDDDDDDSSDDDSGNSAVEIEPDSEIMFRAESMSWHGKNPSDIEDEENPTLQLTEGETYTIGWDEGDDTEHNIALWDGDESAIDATDRVSDPGDDQTIEFEASSDIAEYVCEPHSDNGMRGDIEVQGGNGEENGNESDDENGNESE